MSKVDGKVLHQGKAAKGAIVIFHPKSDEGVTAVRPSGVAGEDGTFTLSTQNPSDGAIPGEYLVTIIWPDDTVKVKARGTEPPPDLPDRLKGRYAAKDTSGLKVVIKPGINHLEPFDLK